MLIIKIGYMILEVGTMILQMLRNSSTLALMMCISNIVSFISIESLPSHFYNVCLINVSKHLIMIV